MKQISFSVKQIVTSLVLLFLGSQCIQAQTSPSINSTMSIQTDAVYGPTLYICSNKETNDYTKSKALAFGVPVPYSNGNPNPSLGANPHTRNTGFVLVKVGVDIDGSINTNSGADIIKTAGSWLYLDEAINFFLTQNYQRIVILEGEYEVNGPIILDYTNGSTNSLARGRITIEGEGFGTRITNATTYTTGNIFEVRSYYNTIKNLSILSENNNTCLALTTANSTVDVRNNIFENLYIGHKAMNGGTLAPNASLVSNSDASPLDSNPIRVGVYLESSIKQIGYNRFHNIHFFSVDKGIVLTGVNRVHDNIFENFSFENTLVGVDFLSNVNTTDNIFNNLTIQATSYTKNLIRNINGRHNSFMSCNFNDWNSLTAFTPVQNNHSFITITSGAEHTTVQNSEVGRGTVIYLIDGGKYTQLINNYGGNSDVTYRLGNDTSDNASAISKVEVLGEFVSSHDGKNQIYAKNGRTIIGNINPNLLTQINTQDPNTDYKLIVNGKVRVRNKVYVKEAGLTWPDYVFANDYKLMPLQQVAQHIQEKGHLPNMPSATEVEKDGIAVGDIIKRQQEKM